MNPDPAREQMVNQQVRAWDVLDPKVLDVLFEVPRELFVPERYRGIAFADANVPLLHDQVMLRPAEEGRLLQALSLRPEDRVLEVGTGSGFVTACLSRLAGHITSIDIYSEFTEEARVRLARQRVRNVALETIDLWNLEPDEQFDAIALTGSLPEYDPRLQQWLAPGGRLFAVVGQKPLMEAVLITRTGEQEWQRELLYETVIGPLLNVPEPEAFVF